MVHDAIEDFTSAGKLENEKPAVYDGLGQCYLVLSNYEEALENFNIAISKEPTNVEFLKNRS